jgi:hypothetical protein
LTAFVRRGQKLFTRAQSASCDHSPRTLKATSLFALTRLLGFRAGRPSTCRTHDRTRSRPFRRYFFRWGERCAGKTRAERERESKVGLGPTRQLRVAFDGERVKTGNSRRWRENRHVEGVFSRIRDARQAAAEPRSAWAPTRKARAAFDGERAKTGNSRRAGAKFAASRAHFHECTMRCSPPPRPARLGAPRAKYTPPLSTVSAPNRESYICGSSEVNVAGHRPRSHRRRSPVGAHKSAQPAARTLAEGHRDTSTCANADASRANTSCALHQTKGHPGKPETGE